MFKFYINVVTLHLLYSMFFFSFKITVENYPRSYPSKCIALYILKKHSFTDGYGYQLHCSYVENPMDTNNRSQLTDTFIFTYTYSQSIREAQLFPIKSNVSNGAIDLHLFPHRSSCPIATERGMVQRVKAEYPWAIPPA